MTDSAVATPPAASPTPAPTPAPAPSPAPAAAARPEWLPEAHWDPQANSIKPDFGTHYSELTAFHKAQTEAQAALAARKPEDIKFEVKLPESVKIPEGMQVKINPDDPRIPIIRDLALKNNWTQEQVDSLVAAEAQQIIAAQIAEQNRIAEEDKSLGANGPALKEAAGNYLKGLMDRGKITPQIYERMKVYATDALTVQGLLAIQAEAAGSVPGNAPGNPPKPAEAPMETRWYQQKAS